MPSELVRQSAGRPADPMGDERPVVDESVPDLSGKQRRRCPSAIRSGPGTELAKIVASPRNDLAVPVDGRRVVATSGGGCSGRTVSQVDESNVRVGELSPLPGRRAKRARGS